MRSRIYDERKNEKRDKVSGANTRAIIFLVTSWTSNDAEKRRISDELTKLKNDRPGNIFNNQIIFTVLVQN